MKHKLLNKSEIKKKYFAFVDLLFPGKIGERNIDFFDELLYKYSIQFISAGNHIDDLLNVIASSLSDPVLLAVVLSKSSYREIFEIYGRTILFGQYLAAQDDHFTMEYIDDHSLFMEMFSYRWNINGTTIDPSCY